MVSITNNQKPVFVLVTADTCGHCKNFKSTVWPTFESGLKQEGKVRIVHINLRTMGDKIGPEYHPDIIKYISWFPTVMMFNGTWDNHSVPLEGDIFNGPMTSTGKPTGRTPLTAQNLKEWIDNKLKEDKYKNPIKIESVMVPPSVSSLSPDTKRPVVIITDNGKPITNTPPNIIPTIGHYYNYKPKTF